MSNWFGRAKHALLNRRVCVAGTNGVDRPNPYRRRFAFETLEPRLTLAAAGLVTAPQTYSGALNGKIVFTSGGHGWKGSGTSYTVDRPEYWQDTNGNGTVIDAGQIVEDFGNQDQLTLYADYLLRAGATVVPMRPIGRQLNEVVLDNDSSGVTYSGSWSDSTTAAAAPRYYDEDYGAVADTVRYRTASISSNETATATYTPVIPAAGFYPVYTWVASGTNRTNQLYKINHTGGQTQIRVDHRLVGKGWVYLGTYHFDAGSSITEGSVVISNRSTDGGSVVVADAIRFGNGMGDYIESGATVVSGKPREDENSYHWVARMIGQGTTLTEAIGSGTTNVSAPSNMAEWMLSGTYNPSNHDVDAVYIGIHSNGSTGLKDTATARGALGLIDSAAPTPHQTGTNGLAPLLGNQVNQDMQNLNLSYPGMFEYDWSTGTTASLVGSYGEINLGSSAEMDATIIEVAYHDNVQDNALLRDPKVRDQIARSIYQGTLQYFSIYGGATNTSLPTPPTNVRAVSNASGQVTISWSAGPSTPSSVYGGAATGFKVYASVDGYGFDGGTAVAGGGSTSVTLSGYDPNTPYYFKVAATNAGGESRSSEVATALPSGGMKQVLIVNGFDRDDRTQNFRYAFVYPDNPDGLTDRVWSRYNNSFDYVVQVAVAIQATKPGVHVASTNNDAVISGAVNLADYDTVIWILGNESTANHTFDSTEQAKVSSFINAGGNLFVSGSEIGWDLDFNNNGRSFYQNTLGASYVKDDAGTHTATTAGGGIFAGLSSFVFSSGAPSTGSSAFNNLDTQMYDVTTPDVLAAQAGAVAALTYSGSGTAAIQKQGTGGKGSIVMFGFPFETMTSASVRRDAIGRILDFFGVVAPVSAIDIQTFVNDQDADSPPGPTLLAGSSATFKYVLTNAGNVALTTVNVTDNNGTPGNTADDIHPTTPSGDNGNGQLDVGETWTYSISRTVIAGQFSTIGSVAAVGDGQNVADSDSANYFGVLENADFNGDTHVDSADFAVWRKNQGIASGALQSQGDANADGAVDTTDYNIWRSQFGTTSGPSSGTGTGGDATAAVGTAAASTIANPKTAALAAAAASIPSVDRGSQQVASAKDAAIRQLSARAIEATTNKLHRDWATLLATLAESNARHDSMDSSFDSSGRERPDAPGTAGQTCSLGKGVTQSLVVRGHLR